MSEVLLPSLSSLSHKRPRINDADGYQLDPHVLITLRGWIELLQRRRESDPLNAFLSESKDTWRSLLEYAEAHTRFDAGFGASKINPFSSVHEVDQRVEGMNDHEDADMYKAEFRKYVIFRSITGLSAYDSVESYREDLSYMFAFEYQFLIFLGRKKGSIKNVIKAIKLSTAHVRKDDTDFPPVPADFFVTAVDIVAKIRSQDPAHSAALPEYIQLLKDAIMKQPSY